MDAETWCIDTKWLSTVPRQDGEAREEKDRRNLVEKGTNDQNGRIKDVHHGMVVGDGHKCVCLTRDEEKRIGKTVGVWLEAQII